MSWLEKFIETTERLLKYPPYLLFVFIAAVLLIIYLVVYGELSEQIWAFFMYSVGGTIWRYVERDFIGETFTKDMVGTVRFKRWVISIYHVGNLSLLIALLYCLLRLV